MSFFRSMRRRCATAIHGARCWHVSLSGLARAQACANAQTPLPQSASPDGDLGAVEPSLRPPLPPTASRCAMRAAFTHARANLCRTDGRARDIRRLSHRGNHELH